MKKKPDNIVFNEDTEQYEAHMLPYATNVGSPVIKIDDIALWKNRNINSANHLFETRYEELKAAYEKLMTEFEYNNIIYNAKFNFEPIIGEIYHLYEKMDKNTFLSLIAPDECNFKHLGSFQLKADKVWQRTDNDIVG
ncbi:DUF2452 domain-containing protein [Spongiivirga citrea]|uniref:DUF2452 domain-containing protein n=2 Tax=Spongiivirga citrea TaxID=1481457 RepID=A0A6M0CQ17_9FLAO|nr:DUF2452 domain-containing protein [Spongiivirga citrea]